MPVPGQHIMQRLSAAVERLQGEEAAARDAAKGTSEEIDRVLSDQSAAFQELAQLYLPRLDDDVERDGWTEMQATLKSIILRKDDARRLADERLRHAIEQRLSAEKRCQSLTAAVADLTQRCDELATQLKTQLAGNTEFQRLSREAATCQAKLEQAQASLEAVSKDASAKLPRYERSRLFTYLARRRFGTPDYHWRGLTRRIDRWVAGLIGYQTAAVGYQFLTTAPQQMQQLIQDQQSSVRSLVAAADAIQQTTAQSLGLASTQEQGSRARTDLENATQALERACAEEAAAREQLASVDGPDCPFYKDALKAFQALLQKTERTLVAARAAQTPELTDDQVVARVHHLDERVRELREQFERQQDAIKSAAKQTATVNELASRARRADFANPQRVFDDRFDLDGRLSELLEGRIDLDSVWHEMHRSQQIDNPTANQAAAVLNGPMAQILLSTMAQVAGSALGAYAARAGQQHRLPKGSNRGWF